MRSASLRASLRCKEGFFSLLLRHDFVALDSPSASSGSSRAKRSSRALTLVSVCGHRVVCYKKNQMRRTVWNPTLCKSGKGWGHPRYGRVKKKNRKGLAIRPLTSVAFRRFVYPPFASILSSVRITDPAGRKGWGTQSMVSERKNGKGRPADNYEIEYG